MSLKPGIHELLGQEKVDVPLFVLPLGEDFTEFLDMFEVIAQAFSWNDAWKLRPMPTYLRGTALAWFLNLGQADKASYALLKAAQKKELQPAEAARMLRLELHSRHWGALKSAGDNANGILPLNRAAYPKAGTFQDQLRMEFFASDL